MHRTPLYNIERDFGASFADYGGWELASDFGDCVAEYHAARESVGLLDRSEKGKLVVTGSDRLTWLQGMLSNDVRPLGAGQQVVCGCVLNATGHLLADVRVIRREESLLLEMEPQNLDKIYRLLEGFIITEDVEIADQTDFLACLSIQGPIATTAWIRDAAADGEPILADHTGLGGFDLYVMAAEAPGMWQRLVDAGARPIGFEAAETLRIEAGIPRYGVDMDETTIPLECNLGSTHISQDKGCYVGQEIIARITSRGHTNRALSGFLLEISELPHKGDKVYPTHGEDADREIGWITSATHSPMLGRGIALGYMRHEFREPGTHVRIVRTECDDVVEARVCALPFSKAA